MADLHDLTALEQAAALRRGEFSATELTEHYLKRSEALSDIVGAFTTLTPELALEQAREADEKLRAGDADLPPLFGVCVPVKDLTAVAGVRMTMGSAVYADFVPQLQAVVVSKLRAAGTVMTGKTTAPEFGLPCYTEPDVAPPSRTPWDLTRTAGGSSGGAAAAVAAGLAPIALGSDGGGSIRIPASVCGLVGFKPSRGRISNAPFGPDPTGLVTHGPLARTVADAAAFVDTVAGPVPGDPWWAAPLPPGETFLARTQADPPPLRIGRFAAGVLTRPDFHPDVLAAWEQATALLRDLGHEVIDIDPPAGPELGENFIDVWSALAASAPVPPGAEEQLRPLTRWLRERGRQVDAARFLNSAGTLQGIARATARAWAGFDAVLTPTLAAPPVLIGALRDDDDPAGDFQAQAEFTPITSFYNLTGQPAVSLPLGVGAGGLPIGVMLAGRPAADGDLFALAAQIERAAPWAHRKPALFA